jgi:putative DNA primase/helicase
VQDVLNAEKGIVMVPAKFQPPCWLKEEGPFPATETLATQWELIHLPSMATIPATPRFLTFSAMDFDYDPDAPSPRGWLGFLGQLWGEDGEAISTLQEWFGYCLLPDTSLQKMLMLVGPKRSGKGTIARVVTGLLGKANVAGPTLASLATNFGLSALVDKSVAIVSDARLSGRVDTAVIVERLLSITGEDALTIDRKYLTPVTCKLPTRFMVLSNELPKLNDASGALVSRMVVLSLSRSFYGHEDHGLMERLLTELPGVLKWAIEGWKRLRARGRFVQPASGQELVGEMDDLSSPVGAFVRERCEVGGECQVEVKALYTEWSRWATETGRFSPGDAQTFGRNLRAAVPELQVSNTREGQEQKRVYRGIKLKA